MKLPDDVAHWQTLREHRKELEASELAARLKLAEKYFTGKDEGTHTFEFANGAKLKIEVKRRYKLDATKTKGVLPKIAAIIGVMLADRLVDWKPELRVGEMRKLPKAAMRLLKSALTVSEATPSLEIVEP